MRRCPPSAPSCNYCPSHSRRDRTGQQTAQSIRWWRAPARQSSATPFSAGSHEMYSWCLHGRGIIIAPGLRLCCSASPIGPYSRRWVFGAKNGCGLGTEFPCPRPQRSDAAKQARHQLRFLWLGWAKDTCHLADEVPGGCSRISRSSPARR